MADVPLLRLGVDSQSTTPLFAQVYEALRARIVAGKITVASRLPSSRALAEELGVSRATVVTAYDQLIAEGFVESRPGSGIYVSDIGEVETIPTVSAPPVVPSHQPVSPPPPQPFQPGHPDMRLFPHRHWGQCLARVARTAPETLVLETEPFGDPVLRGEVVKYLAEWRGVNVHPSQILITAGAGDALEICLRTLAKPGQHVAMEDPGYTPLSNIVVNQGLKPTWMATDADGAQCPPPSGFHDRPVISILTPSSQFPLGGAMTPGRRLEHLSWAKQNFAWIVEDDYDSEFRYGGRPIPALSSYDQTGRTLYIGSFSKIFSNTLRLGFLVIPNQLMSPVTETLKVYGAKASLIAQRPLGLFMQSGLFYRHIRRMRRIYGERRHTLSKLLSEEFGDLLTWKDHQAGMQITVTLPPECDDVALSRDLAHAGVSCPALSTYYKRATHQNGLLIGFCSFTPEEMQSSIQTMKTILKRRIALPD